MSSQLGVQHRQVSTKSCTYRMAIRVLALAACIFSLTKRFLGGESDAKIYRAHTDKNAKSKKETHIHKNKSSVTHVRRQSARVSDSPGLI